MKLSAALAILVGLAVTIALIVYHDAAEIGRAILAAGWGILAVIALHLPQTLFSAFGWHVLITEPRTPGRATFFLLRWIREATNSLLPVAQIGGEFVRARLLVLRGVSLRTAGASVTVDLTTEMVSQVLFTLFGIALLTVGSRDQATIQWLFSIAAVAILLGAAFVAVQRLGLFMLIERILIRAAEKLEKPSLGRIAGLHDSIVQLYRDPRRLFSSSSYHLISWLLGTLETWAALQVLGVDAGLREALIIESLGQAIRSAGFAVPGALGVQEGGYMVICGLLGISPQHGLEVSLLRRIRELALGVPGLVVWHRIEARVARRKLAAMEEGGEPRVAWWGEKR